MMHWARQNNENVVATAVRLADAMLKLTGQHSQLARKVSAIEARMNNSGSDIRSLPGN